MASLSYLQPQLEKIHARAEALDVPTPVIDTLRDLVHALNNPSPHSRALRPTDIIGALSNHNPGKHNSLFSSREHQDAQELFQLLSECVKSEATAVAREIRRDRGLGGLTQKDDRTSRDLSQTVFDGLTANRRSCVECGYTEAVMHFPFDNWQLAVPRLVAACRLEDCLEDYTRLELLNDCICRKCSMLATYQRLEQEAHKTTEAAAATNDPTSSKKKRARDSRKLLARVKAALNEGRIEEDIKGVKLEKVFSRASTKQSMIARPPPVLALHLNRSMHYGGYAAKNNCRVVFPEILDLTPYTTSGQLSTQPSAPISSPPPPIPIQRSITPTPSTYAVPRTLYRLSAVVCHYGQHSFGHYICFRRKPRPPAAGDRRYTPPRTQCAIGCDCAQCVTQGPIRDEDGQNPARPGTGRGWLRISDDSVQECGIERVLQEGAGAFMLYYERVQQPRSLVYSVAPPRASEETIRPEEAHASATITASAHEADGKAVKVGKEHGQNGNGDAVRKHESRERERREERERPVDPRVVRRVSASAHKSPSPSSQQPQSLSQPQSQPQLPPQPQTQPKPNSASRPPAIIIAPPPPVSRSTSGSSAVTAVSTFSTKTMASDGPIPNGHARSHSRDKHPANGSADPSSQRPSMPPPSPSKLRKSRRSVSQADGNPVPSPTTPTPLRA
ncbi:cysteine proteinase [Ganoderma leucocontextum]|nr:cysteine proteinase [Ganoderma leucocontextum]